MAVSVFYGIKNLIKGFMILDKEGKCDLQCLQENISFKQVSFNLGDNLS